MTDKPDVAEQTSASANAPCDADLMTLAERLLATARHHKAHIATAESCTGGLVCGLLTEVPGSSDVIEGGFITYSNDAKHASIGVPKALLNNHGAVSEPVARAMAEGALARLPTADVTVAITGIAGPGGGSPDKPVGLVHFAVSRRSQETDDYITRHIAHQFANTNRATIRRQAAKVALEMLEQLIIDTSKIIT